MRRRFATAVFGSIVLGSLSILGGCGGGGGENTTVQDSPEAQKANNDTMDAMKAAMESNKTGGKSAGKAAAKP